MLGLKLDHVSKSGHSSGLIVVTNSPLQDQVVPIQVN